MLGLYLALLNLSSLFLLSRLLMEKLSWQGFCLAWHCEYYGILSRPITLSSQLFRQPILLFLYGALSHTFLLCYAVLLKDGWNWFVEILLNEKKLFQSSRMCLYQVSFVRVSLPALTFLWKFASKVASSCVSRKKLNKCVGVMTALQ